MNMKFKKAACAVLLAGMMVSSLSPVTFAENVTVVLDGKKVESDVAARIENGRTLVPMRAIFEAFGMNVEWNGEEKSVTASNDEDTVVLSVGKNEITVNGKTKEIDAAPIIEDGTTLVPVRAAAEGLDAVVTWDDAAKTVNIETKKDDESWKENVGKIDLTSMTAEGEGVKAVGNTIEITSGGDFEVTGENDNAMIHVNTAHRVKLRLSGVKLKNESGPAIFFENCSKAFITVSKGTENTISDGKEYSVDAKAALFANDDLEIKGEGTLNVVSESHHAIASDDDVRIEEGTLILKSSEGDGIHANNKIKILGGDISITSGGDGIQSEEDVIVEGGKIQVTALGEVSESVQSFGGREFGQRRPFGGQTPSDGELPSGDEAPFGGQRPPEGEGMPFGGQRPPEGEGMPFGGQRPPEGEMPEGEAKPLDEAVTENEESGISSKGIKADENISISGGDITVTANDHAIHAAQQVDISGGTLNLTSSKAKGISAHGNVNITGGEINVIKSTEGIESKATMNISGGKISVTASDDGINCGGTDGRDVRDQGNGETGHDLYITGGEIYVNASGDGLDANGIIYVKGGEIKVDGPVNNGNGAIDAGSGIVVTGGTMIAVGASGMAEAPGEKSTQASFSLNSPFEKGTKITVADSEGEEIYSFVTGKSGGNIVFTSPDIKVGETYTVTVGDEKTEIVQSGVTVRAGGAAGGFFGGRGGFGKREF